MHQIIKQRGSYSQLFIKITFAFMKIFDFLVKIAIFEAFLFRSIDLRHAHSELLRETIHSLAIGAFYQSDGSRAIFQVFSEQLIKYFCNFFIF